MTDTNDRGPGIPEWYALAEAVHGRWITGFLAQQPPTSKEQIVQAAYQQGRIDGMASIFFVKTDPERPDFENETLEERFRELSRQYREARLTSEYYNDDPSDSKTFG